jgi:HSP20 family protein
MIEKSHTAGEYDSGFWPSFLQPIRHAGARIADFFAPSAEASEADEHYQVDIELPGVAAQDVVVEVRADVLTVKGTKRVKQEEKGKTYYFSERRHGEFHRTFRLPDDVFSGDVKAEFTYGVLQLSIPKRENREAEPVRIKVKGH